MRRDFTPAQTWSTRATEELTRKYNLSGYELRISSLGSCEAEVAAEAVLQAGKGIVVGVRMQDLEGHLRANGYDYVDDMSPVRTLDFLREREYVVVAREGDVDVVFPTKKLFENQHVPLR